MKIFEEGGKGGTEEGREELSQKGPPSLPRTPSLPLPRLSAGGEAARQEFLSDGNGIARKRAAVLTANKLRLAPFQRFFSSCHGV